MARAARRLARWSLDPVGFPAPTVGGRPSLAVYEERIPLRRVDPHADPALEEGKRVNLALAAPRFDGVMVTPERPLSFCRTLGRVTAARGFRPGLELRGGCLVPSVGGGICLLSNLLFGMAAQLGWRVLERHGHSLEAIPPRPGELWGLDATIRWPDVDLRVAPTDGVAALTVRVEGDVLRLTVHADRPAPEVVLQAVDERLDGGLRTNRILRTIGGATEVLCTNRRRLVHDPSRTCRTCGGTGCLERAVAP